MYFPSIFLKWDSLSQKGVEKWHTDYNTSVEFLSITTYFSYIYGSIFYRRISFRNVATLILDPDTWTSDFYIIEESGPSISLEISNKKAEKQLIILH